MRKLSIACAAAIAVGLVSASSAGAAEITPTTTTDNPGDGCTLREAIDATNFDSVGSSGCVADGAFGSDVIQLPAGTYVLTSGQLTKNADSGSGGSLTINHTGGGVTAVDGNDSSRVFVNGAGGTLTLAGFGVQNGFVTVGSGGGISNSGVLTLVDMAVTDNVGGTTSGDGGGIVSFSSSTLNLSNVTIAGNRSEGSGGGVFSAGTLTANNVTIAGNTADTDSAPPGDGGGLYRDSGSLSLANTLISGNTDTTGQAPDCAVASSLTSNGFNLIGNASGCTFAPAEGDIVGTPAQLAALAQNGGASPTMALLPGSPGADDGNPDTPGSNAAACLDADQRGIGRPRGTACDIGAYEAEPPNAITLGKLSRDKKKGNATLAVSLPYGGQLEVSGTGVAASKSASFTLTASGTVKVRLAATGKQKRTLKKKGKVTLTVNLAFDPINGTPSATTTKVKLEKKKKKKK